MLHRTIEFDQDKNLVNIKKHGISLAQARLINLNAAHYYEDKRKDYGETRYIVYGHIMGRLHACIITFRGDTIRVISLRKAKPKEVAIYETAIKK